MSTAELKNLKPGEWSRTIFTSDKGRIVDVVTIIDIAESSILITTEHTEETLIAHLDKYIIMDDVALTKSQNHFHSIIISSADESVEKRLSKYFGDIPSENNFISKESHSFLLKDNFKFPKFIIYTTENNVLPIKELFPELINLSDEEYELFRIKKGIAEGKNEFNDLINPKEINFEELISYTKGCYIGQEVIARLDSQGKIPKKIVKIVSDEEISKNDKVFLAEELTDVPPHRQGMVGKEVGFISSAIYVPMLERRNEDKNESEGKTFALGIIRTASLFADKKYYVQKGDKKLDVEVEMIF